MEARVSGKKDNRRWRKGEGLLEIVRGYLKLTRIEFSNFR